MHTLTHVITQVDKVHHCKIPLADAFGNEVKAAEVALALGGDGVHIAKSIRTLFKASHMDSGSRHWPPWYCPTRAFVWLAN